MLIILVVLFLLSTPVFGQELKKMSLDDASDLGTRIQTDLKVKTEGKASIRITTRHPTTVCLGEVVGLDVENAKLVFKAKVKSDLSGVAFWKCGPLSVPVSISQKE